MPKFPKSKVPYLFQNVNDSKNEYEVFPDGCKQVMLLSTRLILHTCHVSVTKTTTVVYY